MTETIYIPLEDEGTPVRRPARAYRRDDGKYIVLRPADYDPTIETWTFPPGTIVECDRINGPEGEVLVAARLIAVAGSAPGKQAV
jgi:hypothetical protein